MVNLTNKKDSQLRPSRVVANSVEAMSVKYNTMVYELKRNNVDVVVLSLGEAFFDLPLLPMDRLPQPEIYHYSDSRGLPELRQKLSEYFLSSYDVDFDPDTEIIVTAGSKIAIHMSLMSILDPGDEVIIHEPAWVSYPEQVRLCHAVPVQVPHFEQVFDFEKYITSKTKAIIVNNPQNPTGRIFTLEELTFLDSLARDRGLFILSDEAYSDFVPDRRDFHSLGILDKAKDHTIICNSISKNMGISGWRLGYTISNPSLINQILKVNQHLITCPATILEYYVSEYYSDLIEITKPQIQETLRKRQVLSEYLNELGLKFFPGTGTFYLFVSIEESRLVSEEFCTQLLESHRVSTVPGLGYGSSCDKFRRVSVGTESMERTTHGLNMIKALIEETPAR